MIYMICFYYFNKLGEKMRYYKVTYNKQHEPTFEWLKEHTPPLSTDGNYFQRHMDISYQDIVAKLGNPHHEGDCYKTDAEWELGFIDKEGNGLVATIYNWKNGRNYLGAEGLSPEFIDHWHIGGHSGEVFPLVKELLGVSHG